MTIRGKKIQSDPETVSIKVTKNLTLVDIEADLDMPDYNRLTPEILGNIMSKSAKLSTRWNVLAAEAIRVHETKKAELKVWEAQAYERYRIALSQNSSKAPTEKTIKSAVEADSLFFEKQKEVFEAGKEASMLRSVAEGFREKGRNAGIISSLLKSEMNNIQSNATPGDLIDRI